MYYWENKYTNILHKAPHQTCTRCVMDTSDPLIKFDEEGVCNHCLSYDSYIADLGDSKEKELMLEKLVDTLRAAGKGKDYDCIMGLSGGVDSSYLSWFVVKKLGLRPLVVHVDAGWNSELAVNNIQNLVEKLGIDLHTLVIDWEEMRDLQKSYFKSGIANLDVPQDHAFIASLYSEASKFGIKHILNGGNMQTESILPTSWGYDANDARSLTSIQNKFGSVKLKNYPIYTHWHGLIYYPYIKRMKTHRPLEWIDYSKDKAKDLLINEMGWRDYGGKHYESTFTKFFQAHYLPTKFGYDKRKAHLASLVVSGQLSKEDALNELELPLYDSTELEEDRIYWCKKLGIQDDEYNEVMSKKPSFYSDFPNNEKRNNFLRKCLKFALNIYRLFKKK